MPGIYIHIPFCKQRCNYCNFHFSTQLQHTASFIDALKVEMALQRHYLPPGSVKTLYVGGGTPSILTPGQVRDIFSSLEATLEVDIRNMEEVTFEVNPDDISEAYLRELKDAGVKRLSIGIQSFKEADLRFMHRAHTMEQSQYAIEAAVSSGFDNVSIDLIYGIPGLSHEEWVAHIEKAVRFGITHISAYALTVEPRTLLEQQVRHQKVPPLDEEQAAVQFELLVRTLAAHGYEQYEISNFALPGHYAIHNTNYWKKEWYLGLGPSAHSFNGSSRQWNIANNALYSGSLLQRGELQHETEQLTEADNWNEYVMTGIRTMWGLDLQYMNAHFRESFLEQLMKDIVPLQEKGWLESTPERIVLTMEGKLYADRIAGMLFV